MRKIREIVFYRDYFHDFYERQPGKVKDKIDYVFVPDFRH